MDQLRKQIQETHDSTIRQEGMLERALLDIESNSKRLDTLETKVVIGEAQVGLLKLLFVAAGAIIGLVLTYLGLKR